jgi:hypothetical protein
MLNIITLSVLMIHVSMLNVVMLNVVGPVNLTQKSAIIVSSTIVNYLLVQHKYLLPSLFLVVKVRI